LPAKLAAQALTQAWKSGLGHKLRASDGLSNQRFMNIMLDLALATAARAQDEGVDQAKAIG
jgi:hypothetical protein